MKKNSKTNIKMPIVKNWYLVKGSLIGHVYNHPTQENGSVIRTSKIVSVRGDVVLTTQSHYLLGKRANEKIGIFDKLSKSAKRFFHHQKQKEHTQGFVLNNFTDCTITIHNYPNASETYVGSFKSKTK